MREGPSGKGRRWVPRLDGTGWTSTATRPFWEWRFANALAVRRCEIEIEDIAYTDEGLLVVDFHEQSNLNVRGFDGAPAERDADLHNRNIWHVSEERMTIRGGEELKARRTIDGQPLTDDIDPWGSSAWAHYRDSQGA